MLMHGYLPVIDCYIPENYIPVIDCYLPENFNRMFSTERKYSLEFPTVSQE